MEGFRQGGGLDSSTMKNSCETVNGNGPTDNGHNIMSHSSYPPCIKLCSRKTQMRKGMLDSIPEYDATECQKDAPSGLALQISEYPHHKPENEDYYNMYPGTDYLEGEDGELSWFNAGVRVGVGIGLGVCLGIGIGVGLLVRTYQGTARNFRRRLL